MRNVTCGRKILLHRPGNVQFFFYLKFDDGKGIVINTDPVFAPSAAAVPDSQQAGREGYHFAGWQGDVPEDGKESLSVSLVDGDVTLRAVFDKND